MLLFLAQIDPAGRLHACSVNFRGCLLVCGEEQTTEGKGKQSLQGRAREAGGRARGRRGPGARRGSGGGGGGCGRAREAAACNIPQVEGAGVARGRVGSGGCEKNNVFG